MKVMDIRVSIDVSNDAHREALNTFMEALGGKGVVVTEEAPAKKKSRKKPKPEPEVEEDEEDE